MCEKERERGNNPVFLPSPPQIKKTRFNIKNNHDHRDGICVVNFIPPVNGASLGRYFKAKSLNSA